MVKHPLGEDTKVSCPRGDWGSIPHAALKICIYQL